MSRERRTLPDGRPAPRLLVAFQCPACFVTEVRDAFLGVPLHACRKPEVVMLGERIVHPDDAGEVPGR